MQKLITETKLLMLIAILMSLVFLDSFMSMYEKRWQDQAVEHGCGYYHPETERFKWIDK